MPLPNVATRSAGSWWAVLSSDCRECHAGYVGLPRTSYLMWKGYLPVKCVHGGTILDMLIDPNREPGAGGLVRMPERVEAVEPAGASESSGGETTAAKLQNYTERLAARAQEAVAHLLAYINVAEHSPAPHYFPELQVEYLRARVALVEERAGGLEDALQIQLRARREVEQDFHEPPCPLALSRAPPPGL